MGVKAATKGSDSGEQGSDEEHHDDHRGHPDAVGSLGRSSVRKSSRPQLRPIVLHGYLSFANKIWIQTSGGSAEQYV